VAAHITAAALGGPRYDSSFTVEQRASPENGIWLCQNCAALIDRDVHRFTVDLLHAWKTVAEDRARNQIGKTFQLPIAETEAKRKMRKILEMKKPGQMVTLRYLNAPEHSNLLGRVKAEIEVFVQDCDEDCVLMEIAGSGTNKTLPLEKIMIGRDDARHRPALECKP
jgi:hypothetical protein